MKFSLPTYNQLLGTAAVVVASLFLWTLSAKIARMETGKAAPAAVASEVRAEPKVDIHPPKVQAYRPAVKAKFNLPAEALGNVNEQVLSASTIKADSRPHTVITTLDTATGEVKSYDRPDPLPWLAPGQQGAIGVAYGYKNGLQVGRLYARQDLVQVKALHAGAMGTLDTDGEWFAGGFVEFRF